MAFKEVAFAVSGGALGYLASQGLADVSVKDYNALRTERVENCQYTLDDAPQVVPELSDACDELKEFILYNNSEGNYYLPSAEELPDFIPPTEQLYADEIKTHSENGVMRDALFVILGVSFGAAVGIEWKKEELQK